MRLCVVVNGSGSASRIGNGYRVAVNTDVSRAVQLNCTLLVFNAVSVDDAANRIAQINRCFTDTMRRFSLCCSCKSIEAVVRNVVVQSIEANTKAIKLQMVFTEHNPLTVAGNDCTRVTRFKRAVRDF